MTIRDPRPIFQNVPTAAGSPARPQASEPALPGDSAQSPSSLALRLASVATEAARLRPTLGEHVEGEVIVKLRPGGAGLMDDFASEYGASVAEKFDVPKQMFKDFEGDLMRLKLPAGVATEEAMALMKKDARVAYAVPNNVYHLDPDAAGPAAQASAAPAEDGQNVPNDLDPQLWGLRNTGQNGGKAGADIHAVDAWAVSTGQREGGPLIALVDTGADYNHPDLVNNIWTNPGEIPGDGIDNDGNGVVDDVHGYNAYANNGNPMDGHSHGTHCAGTIGAEGNNGQGVVGVNWQARIMPVKIFSDSGSTTTDAILRGHLYASKMGARLTSNSWGGGAANKSIEDVLRNSPALHIFAAGNDGKNNDSRPTYPASYDIPNIVAVAATDKNDTLASFSNYGRKTVDVAAPGVGIYSTVPNGGYGNKSGTSMATPHVAGMTGLILTAHPELTNDQVKARLINSSDKVSSLNGKTVSNGRVNLARALENDKVAPAAPNDFRATSVAPSSVTVSWTATGDDRWCGQASGYELRYSDKPIVDGTPDGQQIGFEDAIRVETADPGLTGTIESAQVPVTPAAEPQKLYVGLKIYDNVGNLSELRTVEVDVPAAPPPPPPPPPPTPPTPAPPSPARKPGQGG